ncbi:MAG: manganese efflux pump [Clostridiales bacterium]|nr:manganese efflux pump [Clostridiales bacterium]
MFTLICLSLSLAADAFVTAICDGLAYSPKTVKRIAIALSFGAMQGIMPVIGALCGDKILGFLDAQNYVAFAVLFIIGVLMFIEGFDKKARSSPRFGAKTIAFQAFATSVDAFACGLTLNTISLPLWVEGLTIGGVTTLLCAVGVFFAGAIGKTVARPERFKIIGGLVLISLALKNLVYCFL